MNHNLDKNKIQELIKKSRKQNLLHLSLKKNQKNTKKLAIDEVVSFIGVSSCEVIVIKV